MSWTRLQAGSCCVCALKTLAVALCFLSLTVEVFVLLCSTVNTDLSSEIERAGYLSAREGEFKLWMWRQIQSCGFFCWN